MDYSFNVDSTNIKKVTDSINNAIIKSIRISITNLSNTLTNNIKTAKLSGQVLKVRTGNLRSSISNKVLENNNNFSGIVYTRVKYAGIHEYGFKGSETVKEHVRQISQVFGKSINKKQITIGSHTRNVNYPQRSFMRSALKDIEPKILNEINKNIIEEISKI